MKNILFPRLFLLLIIASVVTSCSKENIPEQRNEAPSSELTAKPASSTDGQAQWPVTATGSITGMIQLAGMKATVIVVFNNSIIPGEHRVDPKTGQFIINNLTDGVYSLIIKYAVPGASDYSYKTVSKIMVAKGELTDIGVITIPAFSTVD